MIKRKWYFLVFVLAVVFVFTGMALSAPKKPTTVAELALYNGADRQQILEEGAKKEGKLIFYTSGILTQAVRPVVDAFQKKYPYIKVDVIRVGSSELIPRLLTEYRAGKYFPDVIEAPRPTQSVFQREGITQPFFSSNLAYIQEGAITKAPGGGVFAGAFRESGIGLAYNIKLTTGKIIPKTYQDL